MQQPSDDLAEWIESVSERLACGEFAGLPAIPVGPGMPSLPGEMFVRIMLADYDHYDDLSLERRRERWTIHMRIALLHDLRQLRDQIG